ncbi:MAG: hypothetical protein ACREMT_06955 [Vulcanimicrobiaceae bacterium]
MGDVGYILVALGIALLVAVALLRDEQKSLVERALYKELREVQGVSEGLWDSLGPDRYGELVTLYIGRSDVFSRAAYVLDFWDRAGRAYMGRRVNRVRFVAKIAPKCDGFWRDYADLIAFMAQQEPDRIAAWRRLQRAALRHLDRDFKKLEKIAPRKAA